MPHKYHTRVTDRTQREDSGRQRGAGGHLQSLEESWSGEYHIAEPGGHVLHTVVRDTREQLPLSLLNLRLRHTLLAVVMMMMCVCGGGLVFASVSVSNLYQLRYD